MTLPLHPLFSPCNVQHHPRYQMYHPIYIPKIHPPCSSPTIIIIQSYPHQTTNLLPTVSAYSIRKNSTIALVGSAPAPPPFSPQNQNAPNPQHQKHHQQQHQELKTEQSTITQIRTEVEKVRETLVPSVDTFLRGLKPPPPSLDEDRDPTAPTQPPPHPQPEATTLPNPTQTKALEHTRLSELLLQSLLRLDAIQPDGSWEAARSERKGAVREVQGLLERLDGGWEGRGV